jgi:hypothetical protein
MEKKGQNRIQEDTDKRGKVIWDDRKEKLKKNV